MNDWRQFFSLSSAFRTQSGQAKAWEIAATVAPWEGMCAELFEFVTGYGKTIVAYGMYHILRQRDLVDHMLVLVPTDDQRTQFADDAADARALLGITVEAWKVEKDGREVRRVRQGNPPVFVATYQQLDTEGFFRDLLTSGGRWMIVADECHHLGEEGQWASHFVRLPNVVFRLGLSATPVRTDFRALSGLPARPAVRVTYRDAFSEEVVKRVMGKIDHYYIDVDINGQYTRLTTESLRDEGVTDFSQYETRRQLRYNPNYLNKMLLAPLQELALRNSSKPGQHQMIVFCMSCRHAHHVSDQINALAKELGFPFRADWVGVGEGIDGAIKSDEENRAILKSFRAGGLPILVQVGKAQEGFNVKRASVLVFLHLIGADARLIQQIGRGLRRNSDLPFDLDTVTVFGSSDTPLAKVIKDMEAEANGVVKLPGDGGDGPTGPRIYSIPDLIVVDAHYDKTDIVIPEGLGGISPEGLAFCMRFNIPPAEYLAHFHTGRRAAPSPAPIVAPVVDEQHRTKRLAEQVKANTGQLAGNILRLMQTNGHPVDKELLGRVKRAINYHWKAENGLGHDVMLEDDWKRKNAWLQQVNGELQRTREVPSWVRRSL